MTTQNTSLSTAGQFTLLCIASLTIMVGSVVAPGVVTIAEALNVSAHPSWLVTLPALGAIVFAPLTGRIIDTVGAYRACLAGLFLYGLLGMGLSALAEPLIVYVDRLLLGGTTALVMAACTMLISQWYQGTARLAMIAKQGMAIELGGVIFLLLGGQLAAIYWALPLNIYLLAWVFLLMFVRYLPRLTPAVPHADKALNANTGQGWPLSAVYAITLLAMTVFFSLIVVLPISLADAGMNEARIGYLLSFISLVAVVSAFFMPTVVRRLKQRITLTLAFAFFAVAHGLFFLANDLALLMVASIASGLGFGLSIPLLNHMTVQSARPNLMGRCLSYYTMAIFSGQFLTSFITLLPRFQSRAFLLAGILALLTALGLFGSPYLFKSKVRYAPE